MWVTKSWTWLSYFHFTACEPYTGVCPWICPGGLGFVPVKARCGGGTTACVSETLAAPGTQGRHQLGQQDIWHPTRAWLPITVFLPGEFYRQRNLAGHSPQTRRIGHDWSDAACMDEGLFLASGSSAPLRIMHGGGAVAWIMGTLAMLTKWERWRLLSQEIWCY